MSAEIFIKNVKKRYPNGTEALKGVSLEIASGEFFTLLGPNGAGKSTLVKVLNTLISADSGDLAIGGRPVNQNHAWVQRYIGVAGQDNELDPMETPENLLLFQGRLFGLNKHDAQARTRELIGLFGLGGHSQKKTSALSGGNKRRLHCALAMVHQPRVLFLDEPTVGMDPEARANFWEIISELNQQYQTTIFLTTQYLEEADRHASAMALISDGEIRFSGTIKEFKQMVDPQAGLSLDESYLKYIRSISIKETVIA
jgi:ABC-2 type transport system ATP-binding protein